MNPMRITVVRGKGPGRVVAAREGKRVEIVLLCGRFAGVLKLTEKERAFREERGWAKKRDSFR